MRIFYKLKRLCKAILTSRRRDWQTRDEYFFRALSNNIGRGSCPGRIDPEEVRKMLFDGHMEGSSGPSRDI
jgi:hypothetical protein